MAEVTTSTLKLKHTITKGHYGYLRVRKLKLLIGASILLLGIIGLMIINWVVFKTNKTWLSIFAALSAIPMAMEFATFFSIVKFKQRPEEEFDEITELTGNGVLDCEIIVANPNGASFEFPYVYIHETGIYAFSPDKKLDIHATEDYVRNYLRLNKCDGPMTIYVDMKMFKNRLKNLEPSDRDTCSEHLLEQEGIIRAIAT